MWIVQESLESNKLLNYKKQNLCLEFEYPEVQIRGIINNLMLSHFQFADSSICFPKISNFVKLNVLVLFHSSLHKVPKMIKLTFIYTLISILCQVSESAKVVTTLDDIELYANPKYLNASVKIVYTSENHDDYLLNVEEDFGRDVGNVYVILF